MRWRDSRRVYFVPPRVLLGDLERAFAKLGLECSISEAEGGWELTGSRASDRVRVTLSYTLEDVFRESRAIGEIPVSTIVCEVEGDREFVETFKRALEVSLLRCLG